jgi:hypothetical protein
MPRSPRLPLSPIELLLPNGFAERAIVLGDACPGAFAPASSEQTADGTPVDLVLLAPSTDERRDSTWVRRAVHTAVSRLASSGIAYVVPSSAIGLRRALAAGGLRSAETLLHIPDLAQSRYVVPVGTAAERYALSGQLPMKRVKRFAAAALLHSRRLATLGPTGIVLRPNSMVPLAGWLWELEGAQCPAGSVLVRAGGTAGGSVLHRFAANEKEPNAVAKVSRNATAEVHALQKIAPSAARAGARIPTVLYAGALASVPLVLQSAVSGRNAALLVERKRLAARDIQERIAAWLARWGRSSAQVRELTQADLERFVLAPAIELAPRATGRGPYLEYLRVLCSRALGARCPFVPSHGDLTVANIVVDDGPELGIVDWEAGSEDSLPLMDFFYAAADAAAATQAYSDRPGAVASCFAAGGAHASFVAGLRLRLAEALGVADIVQEMCFHACWLHHATNDAARSARSYAGPFVTILQTIASDPERYSLLQPTR